MGYETMPIRGVSNHYGPRVVGGTEGSYTTDDNKRTYAFDGTEQGPLNAVHTVAKSTGRVLSVTGDAPTTLTVAGTDVSAAEYATPVEFDASGENQAIVFTGSGKTLMTVEFDAA